MQGIFVSELNELQLSHNLRKDNSEIVIYSLIEGHVVNVGVDALSNSSDSFDSMRVNVIKKLVYSYWSILNLGNECSQEFNHIRILVIDTEVEAVEESHGVLFDVI